MNRSLFPFPSSGRNALLALLVATALGATGSRAASQEGGQGSAGARVAANAVVLVRAYDSRGNTLAAASGFILPDRRVVTTTRVLQEAGRVEIIGSRGQLLGVAHFADVLSASANVAILPALGEAPGHLYLAADSTSVGEPVMILGARDGSTSPMSQATVYALKDFPDRRRIQLSTPAPPGASGGPVLNSRTEVVGVSAAEAFDGQIVHFAIPVSDIRALQSSPPGRLAFPGRSTSAAGAAQTAGAEGESRPARSYRHFKIGMVGCHWRGSVAVCELQVENVDSARAGSTRFNLHSALVQGGNAGRAAANTATLGETTGPIGNRLEVSRRILPGEPTRLQVEFARLPLNVRGAALRLGVSVGALGNPAEVEFEEVEIVRRADPEQ